MRNHGLDAMMEEHFRMSKRFFQLPTDRKLETMLDENAKCVAWKKKTFFMLFKIIQIVIGNFAF